jgi:hypothetical protein
MRSLIEQVIVHAREGGGFEVELVGEIASMVEVASIPTPAAALRCLVSG